MWIFTPYGFVSVVEDTSTGDLVVRARRKDHLEKLFPGRLVVTTKNSDYRHRIFIDRYEMARVVAGWVTTIDYENFKGKTGSIDEELAELYGEIWSLGLAYQQESESRP